MDIRVIKRLEYVCIKCELDLQTFGEKFEKALTLPKMKHDFENETEWLEIEQDGINYNISKPFEEGTLQEWDDTTPEGCNFGIVLSLHKDHPFVQDDFWVDNMVANVCKQLAKTFNVVVYHHKTFNLGIDKIKRKSTMFNP